MSRRVAIQLLVLSLLLMALGFADVPAARLLAIAGVDGEQAPELSVALCTGLALVGLVFFAVSVSSLVWGWRREQAWRPIHGTLNRIAGEYGLAASIDVRRGMRFATHRERRHVYVEVQPHNRAVLLTCADPGNMLLAWVGDGVAPEPPWADWRAVGGGRRWRLRAETPMLARRIHENPALQEDLEKFFELFPTTTLIHDRNGLRVESDLPRMDLLDRQLRSGIELCYRILRLNG
jgi:hypothetical protein